MATTLTFSTNDDPNWGDGIAEDGNGGSIDIGGLALQITNISDLAGTAYAYRLVVGEAELSDGFAALTTYEPSLSNGAGWKGMQIKSADGADFQINGLDYWNYGEISPLGMTVKGYRDGIEVASFSFATVDTGGWQRSSVSLDASFDAVDSVVLYSAGTSWHGLNAIQIDNAVSPLSAPSLTATGASPTFTEDGSAVDLFSGVSAATNDAGQTFSGLTLTVTNVANGASEVVTVGGTAIGLNNGNSGTISGVGSFAVAVAGGTATITLSGMAQDNTQLAALVDGISYRNTSESPGTTSRVVTITDVVDSGGSNNSAAPNISATVAVTATNDASTATNLTQAANATEDGGTVALNDIVVTDPDIGDVITATLTLGDPAAGALTTGTYGSVTSTFNGGTGVWTVTGSVSDVNAALAAVAVNVTANWDQDITLTSRIRDSADTGPADGTISIAITPVNDAPAVTATGGSASYVENASPAVVDSGLALADVDNSTLASATVAITTGFIAAQDTLAFTNDGSTMGNITASFDGATGALTLTSAGITATVAQWQAALRAVTYVNSSDEPTTSSRTISFVVNDGATDSVVAARTLSVTAVNDAPGTNPAAGYLNEGATTETGAVIAITNAMLHEGDLDDVGAGITYTVATATTAGTLFLDSNANGAVDGGEALGVASTFTQDDIDLGRIKYQHGGGAGTADSFTFAVADGGEDGAAALTGQVFDIAIAARPVLTGGGGSPAYVEDGTPVLIAPALTIADDDSPDMAGATVTVTDLVTGDSLGFIDQSGITGSYNASTGVLTLTGTATRGSYEAALRSVTFSSTNNNPATGAGNGDRVIAFSVTDTASLQSVATNATVSVTNGNDAPTLDATASPVLSGVGEDTPAPVDGSTAGSTLVSALLGGVAEVDTGGLTGIAIVDKAATGTLWYSTDGGTTWTQVPAVSASSALLLQSDARLYYQPAADADGSVTDALTIRAWDRTSGSNGGAADTTTNGGGTAFSTATDTVAITVSAINDAPVIGAGPLALPATDENTTTAAVSVADLLADLGLTDADTGAASGAAVSSATGAGGWHYSTDAGDSWHSVGAVNAGSALLLDGAALLRYQPDAANGEAGVSAPAIELRGWDQTTGSATSGATRTTADTTINGGATAFSTSLASVSVTVDSLNDAPVIDANAEYAETGTDEDTASASAAVAAILADANLGDVDTVASAGMAVTAATGNGSWQYSVDGTAWTDMGVVAEASALLLDATTQVRFLPNGIDGGPAAFTYRAWDQTAGTASTAATRQHADTSVTGGSAAFSANAGIVTVDVTAINDAPVVTATAATSAQHTTGSTTGIALFAEASISTVELADSVTQLTIRISGLKDGAAETLLIAGTEVVLQDQVSVGLGLARTASVSGIGDGIVELTIAFAGGVTAADVEALIETVHYLNTSVAPTVSTPRTIELSTVTDSGGGTATATLAGIVATATVVSPPPPPPPATTETVDGVNVETVTVTNPDGSISQTITIPVVEAGREELVGGNTVADIPLITQTSGGSLLTAQVPTGYGLQVTGTAAPQGGASGLAELIQQIQARTPAGSSTQDQLIGGGSGFLQGLASDVSLLVQTIVPTTPTGASAPTTPLVITGLPTTVGTPVSALVIDTRSLPTGSIIQLDDVSFAALIGAVKVTGGAGAQTVWGDDAAQHIVLGADDDVLHGGGGDDIVGSAGGDDRVFGNAGNDQVFGGAGNDLLHGGADTDVATYEGAMERYEITRDHGKTIVRSLDRPDDVDTLVNVETIRFDDGDYTVQNDVLHVQIASLYQQVLSRQADLDGFQYWNENRDAGMSIGGIAMSFLYSAEYATLEGAEFLGLERAAQLDLLYEHFLQRDADASGHAYWMDALAAGMTIDEIADGFVNSIEMQGVYLQHEGWEFI